MSSTIFDDVFRTMVEKMPYLAVPWKRIQKIKFLKKIY